MAQEGGCSQGGIAVSKGGVSFRRPDQGNVLLRRKGQEVMEGLEGGGTTWDETVVEIHPKTCATHSGYVARELLDHLNL